MEWLDKIVLHEIGLNLGLDHCTNDPQCLMNAANESIKEVDQERCCIVIGLENCWNNQKKQMIKRILLFTISFTIIIAALNLFKHPFVWYLPFNIPGKQMASTIPPLGMFIEKDLAHENKNDPCSVFTHEMVHWKQYERMGLFKFYYHYIKNYLRTGRVKNWMEEEARRPCKDNHSR